MLALLGLLIAALVSGCSDEETATQVMVWVDAQQAVIDRADTVHITIAGGASYDALTESRVLEVGIEELPVRIALVPDGDDAGRVFSVVAEAQKKDATTVARSQLRSGYLAKQLRSAYLLLEDGCQPVDFCQAAADETCQEGACVGATITPDGLSPGAIPESVSDGAASTGAEDDAVDAADADEAGGEPTAGLDADTSVDTTDTDPAKHSGGVDPEGNAGAGEDASQEAEDGAENETSGDPTSGEPTGTEVDPPAGEPCPEGTLGEAVPECAPTLTVLQPVIEQGTLRPAFDPRMLNYDLWLSPHVLSATVELAAGRGEIQIGGETITSGSWQTPEFALSEGEGPIVYIDVSDGTRSSRYKLTLRRAVPESIDQSTSAGLGHWLAFDGDVLVAGHPFQNGQQGQVLLYRYAGYDFTGPQVLPLPQTVDGYDHFGFSVAMAGATLAVGAPDHAEGSGAPCGAVFVYQVPQEAGDTVGEPYVLKPSHCDDGDDFGAAVSMHGDTLLVGAPGEDSAGQDPTDNSASKAGAAYIFSRGAVGERFEFSTQLKADVPSADSAFGESVSVHGDYAAVGNRNDSALALRSGVVHIYRRGTDAFEHLQRVAPSIQRSNARFGRAVALFEDRLLVGAPGDPSSAIGVDGDEENRDAEGSGAGYLFKRNTNGLFVQEHYLKGEPAELQRGLGVSVALGPGVAILGAPGRGAAPTETSQESLPETASGAVLIFREIEVDGWTFAGYYGAVEHGLTGFLGESIALSPGDFEGFVVSATADNLQEGDDSTLYRVALP